MLPEINPANFRQGQVSQRSSEEGKSSIILQPTTSKSYRAMPQDLASPEVLASPDFLAAISGDKLFHLTTDASVNGLGAVVEQIQVDGVIQPLTVLNPLILPNAQNRCVTELDVSATVWATVSAINKNHQLFDGMPFVLVTDHSPLKYLESLSTKVNRVQRWLEVLSAYTYKVEYRASRANSNADLMSCLPLPVTPAHSETDLPLFDPADVDSLWTTRINSWRATATRPQGDS